VDRADAQPALHRNTAELDHYGSFAAYAAAIKKIKTAINSEQLDLIVCFVKKFCFVLWKRCIEKNATGII